MEFLIQLVRRFLGQTPWFHKMLQYVSIVTTVIASIPVILAKLCTEYGLCDFVPSDVSLIIAKAVAVSGVISMLVAQLSVTDEAKEKARLEGKPIK